MRKRPPACVRCALLLFVGSLVACEILKFLLLDQAGYAVTTIKTIAAAIAVPLTYFGMRWARVLLAIQVSFSILVWLGSLAMMSRISVSAIVMASLFITINVAVLSLLYRSADSRVYFERKGTKADSPGI